MTATAERTTTTTNPTSTIPTELWEMSRASMRTFFWAQDQVDTLTRTWMDQVSTSRHDGQRVLETLMSQAQSNHEELTRIVEQGFQGTFHWVPNLNLFNNH